MAAAPPPTTSSPPPPPPPPPRRIVICGGGVIGSCTAYFLSNHNTATAAASITIVEKSSVACAASGKAGGFLALDWSDGTSLSSLSRASFNLHRTLSQRLNGPTNYGYRSLRTLSLSLSLPNPNPNPNPNPLLPSWIDGPVGAPKTIGTPDTTAQLHPKLFTQTLVQNSPGVDVLTGEIKKVQVDDGGDKVVGVVVAVDREERFVPADVVVLSLGPWSSQLPIVSSLFSISGLKAHSIVLRPADPGSITPHALFLSYKDPSTPGVKTLDPEVYPRPAGEVYVCGMSREEKVPDDPEAIVGDPESIEMLHRIAGTVSSGLRRGDGGAEVVAEQACFLPCTEDGLPVIGEMPGVKGCFVATGHSCWGILNGPATGASMAELILEGRSSLVDLSPFSPSRFLRRLRLGRK